VASTLAGRHDGRLVAQAANDL